MSTFEFLFSLFSLLIGLAMAELLGDLGRIVDRRKALRIGWLTPLLAILVLCDLASFWQSAYDYREVLSDNGYAVFAIVAFAGLYYLIATLVIPEDPAPGQDLDLHYAANNRIVIGGMILLNLPNIPMTIMTGASQAAWIVVAIFYALLIGLFIVRSGRANIVMLIAAISIYGWGPMAYRLARQFLDG
jgi:hypothetical protein